MQYSKDMKKTITALLLVAVLFVSAPAKAATQEEINTQLIQLMLQVIDLLKQQIAVLLAQQATQEQIDTFNQQQQQLDNQITQVPMATPEPAPAPQPTKEQIKQTLEEIKQDELTALDKEEKGLITEKAGKLAIFNVATPSQIASCKADRRQMLKDSNYPVAIGMSSQKFDTLTDKQIESYLAERPAGAQDSYLICIKPTSNAYKTQEQYDAYAGITEIDKRLNEIQDRRNALK